MLKRLSYLLLAGLFVMSLSGCLVTESSYLKKADEADSLKTSMSELQQKQAKLASDNSALTAQIEILKGEAAGLTKEKHAAAADKKQLEDLLNAKTDTLSRDVVDLRQKVSDLEKENNRLRENVTVLQKVKVEKVKEVSNTYEQLLRNMKNEIAQGQVTISELKGRLTVNIDAAILFDSGSADVKPAGYSVLGKMVATLKGLTDKAISIEGHTDNVPTSGDSARIFPTNWEFTGARAINVARVLQQQGIDPRNLSAAAFAEYRPVADNGSREGRGKNRRIEITLVPRD